MTHTLDLGLPRPGASCYPFRPEGDSLGAIRAIIIWTLASLFAFWTPLLWLLTR